MDVDTVVVQEVYADGHVTALRVVRSTDGEMPSEDDDAAKATPAKDAKGKSKAKTGDLHTSIPPRLLRQNRPGWGRHPDEEYFHTVPESHNGQDKKRAVFRFWPRDADAKLLKKGEFPGTQSPDGYPWGATLYDFYSVNRIPTIPDYVSFTTGSSLFQMAQALGELDVAAPEIEWAKLEGQPRDEGVADTEELIRCIDTRLQLWKRLDPSKYATGKQDGEQNKEDEMESDDETVPVNVPPTIPITSPFHSSHYPKPWPFTPFENPECSILLQERIPLFLLPETLYVHDPFCLLTTETRRFANTSWTSRPDIVRTYNLRLSQPARSQYESARQKTEEFETFKSRTLIILRYQRTKIQVKNHEPIIEVPLPPYLRRPTKVEEGHLYLSPIAKVGEGHHSIVYQGEWELPRDIFVKPKICAQCFKESADKEIQRLKDTGRWDKLMKAASWGPNGFTGRKPTQAELDAATEPANLGRDGEIIEREITCVVSHDANPSQIVEMVDQTDVWDEFMKRRNVKKAELWFTGEDDEKESEKDSHVAGLRINPPFTYESQKSCTHSTFPAPVPRTAKFAVVAKLSLEGDPHLSREARNYQEFPERFFTFYNGYTIIPQLKSIVPVNAVVPQFYGYYTPKEDTDTEKNPGEPSYLSPILLLEHCGEPIDPDKLSIDDQEECASLLLRFQRAGWLHESVAPRNFLVQRGKPTEFPLTRLVKPELSFRLIDFGRSRKYTTAEEKRLEETQALEMFELLMGQMAVTLSM
jgi:hypothetical protein